MDHATISQKIKEFESRIRKWKQLRFGVSETRVAPRRSTSQDPRKINGCPSATASPCRFPLQSLPVGCRSTPMERKFLEMNFTQSNARNLPAYGDNDNARLDPREVEQKFRQVQANSGKLCLVGQFQDCRFEDFKLLTDLGNGSCGHVAKYQYRDKVMAIKTMPRTNNTEENKRIMMDLDVYTKTGDCPYIVRCYGYFISQTQVRVCMELMATCLDKLLKEKLRNRPFRHDVVGKVVTSVLDALVYLKQRHNVIHRDVKPSNILMDFDGNVKLCDFGISGFLVESIAHTAEAGCPPYMAPERVSHSANIANYDVRSDIWSLGITTVELATGRYPYPSTSEFECLASIMDTPPPRLNVEDGFAADLSDFVRIILAKEVEERPKYDVIMRHPYIERSRRERTDVGSWLAAVMEGEEEMEE